MLQVLYWGPCTGLLQPQKVDLLIITISFKQEYEICILPGTLLCLFYESHQAISLLNTLACEDTVCVSLTQLGALGVLEEYTEKGGETAEFLLC